MHPSFKYLSFPSRQRAGGIQLDPRLKHAGMTICEKSKKVMLTELVKCLESVVPDRLSLTALLLVTTLIYVIL